MGMEGIKVNVNLEEYFKKMDPEDSAEITVMCMNKLCAKAQELKDLYTQLAKTYSIEMSVCDITMLVQVSSPKFPIIPARGLLGTSEGIQHALSVINKDALMGLTDIRKEEEKNG